MIIQPDLLTHWKFQALCAVLGRAEAFTALLALWGHCQNSKTWTFDFTLPMLAGVCQYQGDAAHLRTALLDCRILDQLSNGKFEVHGWAEKNSTLIAAWGNGKKNARQPAADKPGGNPPDTYGSTQPPDSATHGQPMGPPIDREIEGRDGIEGENGPSGPVRTSLSWTLEAGWTGFTPELRALFAKSHPGFDLDFAATESDHWLRNNPGKAATKKNWCSFLKNWLSKSSPSPGSDPEHAGGKSGEKNEGGPPPSLVTARMETGPWRGAFQATYGQPTTLDWSELPPAIQREIRAVLAAAAPLLLASYQALEKNEGGAGA